MSAGWVAGSVRARALARRGLGPQVARRLAAGSLAEALAMLAGTPYRAGPGAGGPGPGGPGGGVPGGGAVQPDLAAAQRDIAAALLWDLRVLAGWLPQGGAQLMRALAGWFEIANVAEKLRELAGQPPGDLFRLGALATAWPHARRSGSLPELRAALARSAWADPGGDTARDLEVGLRARWAQRVAATGEPARAWAASAITLLAAGEWFAAERPRQPVLRSVVAALAGPGAAGAPSFDEFSGRLPSGLSWVLDPVRDLRADLWRAEAAWWARTEREGRSLLGRSETGRGPVLGSVVVLAADARRVSAALEIAARGGDVPAEVLYAVA